MIIFIWIHPPHNLLPYLVYIIGNNKLIKCTCDMGFDIYINVRTLFMKMVCPSGKAFELCKVYNYKRELYNFILCIYYMYLILNISNYFTYNLSAIVQTVTRILNYILLLRF